MAGELPDGAKTVRVGQHCLITDHEMPTLIGKFCEVVAFTHSEKEPEKAMRPYWRVWVRLEGIDEIEYQVRAKDLMAVDAGTE